MNRSNHAPCAIHFIYCCGALILIDMPTKEYRIIVNDKIVDRSYTRSGHKLAVSYYSMQAIPFTIEVVDLV